MFLQILFPPLEEELKDYLGYFKGKVLNAGAGSRDISKLIDGELFNQDLPGEHANHIHIFSPLDKIPKEDGFFDAIICNAVLEHVANPHEVLEEFRRVLKKGGYLYLCVPFMQPEHKCPGDYQRYTKDGLQKIVKDHGFSVVKAEGVHSVYHTLSWIIHCWLSSKRSIFYIVLKLLLYPILLFKVKFSKTYVESLASAYRVLAIKERE